MRTLRPWEKRKQDRFSGPRHLVRQTWLCLPDRGHAPARRPLRPGRRLSTQSRSTPRCRDLVRWHPRHRPVGHRSFRTRYPRCHLASGRLAAAAASPSSHHPGSSASRPSDPHRRLGRSASRFRFDHPGIQRPTDQPRCHAAESRRVHPVVPHRERAGTSPVATSRNNSTASWTGMGPSSIRLASDPRSRYSIM